MKLKLKYGIPFAKVTLIHNGKHIELENVVIDTGSASTIISAEVAIEMDLESKLEDTLHRVRGVGGTEFVYEKIIDGIEVDGIAVENFKIQVGAMNYGFDISAILGMNFLKAGKMIVDCDKLEVYSGKKEST